jgi:hypothetical protein
MSSSTPPTPLTAAEGGPSNTFRDSATVRRAAGPWTPTIRALLQHLENVGFTGNPRVVGDGPDSHGNEVLTFVEGAIQHPRPWTPDGINDVGRLLRQLHEATASFVPPPAARWQPWYFHSEGPDAVIGHCNTGPWHIVARDGSPMAFIDWTLAGPIERRVEVAATAAWNAQLQDDDVAERHGLPDARSRAELVRHFLDGYEVPRAQRDDLVDEMIEFTIRDCAWEARRARIGPDSTDPGPLWSLAWRARSADWMLRNRSLLRRAVQPS